jgi:hypothetical protein
MSKQGVIILKIISHPIDLVTILLAALANFLNLKFLILSYHKSFGFKGEGGAENIRIFLTLLT